jgi:propanol-preferring alcohol dehydrogenase
MKAMLLTKLASLDEDPAPLSLVELPRPEPGDGEVLIEVSACGVCHTELDEIEGRTPPPRLPVIPGHEVVGRVVDCGPGVTRLERGQRVGVGWIFRSSGDETENIDPSFVATGRDVNGGYAEFMVADERYAYPIPAVFQDTEAAPLLCAGGVGYRALRRAELQNGEPLGLTGFGGSGHLVLQLAKHLYPASPVFVFARSDREQAFARELGADWAGDTGATPPEPPASIIDTTPAWKPVLAALAAIRPGGRVVVNAIRKEAGDRQLLADLDYATQLWQEKTLTSVANVTGADIAAFLDAAAAAGIRPAVETLPLEQANDALLAVRRGHLRGARVLTLRD